MHFYGCPFLTAASASAQTDKTPAPAPTLDSAVVKDYLGKFDAGIGTITITWIE
ncbi:MAG: hypothetical protein IPN43_15905 [Chitinophagaceae bacterium]|nr:hypothetical protein [Chitinophagaceae bacterium]